MGNLNNDIQLFNNVNLGEVRVILKDNNDPYFCLTDVCKILDLTSRFVRQRLDDGVVCNHPIIDRLGRTQMASFVNEDGLYDVILESRKPEAKALRKWVTSEVLPSIRKHGAYLTQQALDRALTDPDYLIELATMVKKERALRAEMERQKVEAEQKRLEAEATAEVISEENDLQKEMIEGMSEEVPVAELRQRIVRIMQQRGGGVNIQGAYHALYKEFELKYHMQLIRRMRRDGFTGGQLDYIDKKLNMIPELFDLVCKLFGEEKEKLVKSWSKYVGRPSAYRNLTERKQKIQDVINRKKSEDGEELVEA